MSESFPSEQFGYTYSFEGVTIGGIRTDVQVAVSMQSSQVLVHLTRQGDRRVMYVCQGDPTARYLYSQFLRQVNSHNWEGSLIADSPVLQSLVTQVLPDNLWNTGGITAETDPKVARNAFLHFLGEYALLVLTNFANLPYPTAAADSIRGMWVGSKAPDAFAADMAVIVARFAFTNTGFFQRWGARAGDRDVDALADQLARLQ